MRRRQRFDALERRMSEAPELPLTIVIRFITARDGKPDPTAAIDEMLIEIPPIRAEVGMGSAVHG